MRERIVTEIELLHKYAKKERINIPIEELSNLMILGDIYRILPLIPNESIKVLICDLPYNISKKRKFTRKDTYDINLSFGKWDYFTSPHHKYSEIPQFLTLSNYAKYMNLTIETLEETLLEEIKGDLNYLNYVIYLLTEFKRVLTADGTLYLFTADKYLSFLRNFVKYNLLLEFKQFVHWYKPNPPPRFYKNSFSQAIEHCICVQKSKNSTFNFLSQNEMLNTIEIPLVLGKERMKSNIISEKTGRKKTLHPTQKPIKLMERFIKVSSNEGDLIGDFMAGTFTTSYVAKMLKRNFIAIEKSSRYFRYGTERVRKQYTPRVLITEFLNH